MSQSPSNGNQNAVGYIGLGIMGLPMAGNLLQAGYPLTVWNRTAAKADPLREKGASVADSPRAMAEQKPSVIFLNLRDTEDVEAVVFGSSAYEGIAAGAKPGLVVVDNSTINPSQTAEFGRRLETQGVSLVDAPVSGGDTGAKAGELSIMVGGREDAFETVRPMLEVLGKAVTHLGPTGSGQACKACNQVAVANNLVGTCEAIALARQTGLDVRKMLEVVGAGAGSSWQLTKLGPKIAQGDFDPGFMVELILKDLNIVRQTAQAHGLDVSGVDNARHQFQQVADQGGGKLGTQALAKAIVK